MKRRELFHAALLLAATLGAAFIPSIYKGIFLFGEVIEDPNNLFSFYPWNVFSASLFHEGRFPLYNPFNALGVPHLANLQSAPFYPLHLLLFLHPSKRFFDVFLISRLFLLGYGVYLLARKFGLSHGSALVAMLAAAFSGYFMRYRAMVHLNVEVLIPWAMLFSMKVLDEAKLKYLLILTIILSCSLLGGNIESAFFVYLTISLFSLWLFVGNREKRNGFALVVVSIVFSLLPATIQLFPFFEYLPHAWHIHPTTAGHDWLDARGIISIATPDLFGGIAGFAPYFGAGVLALAIVGANRDRNSLFLLGFSLFLFALIYGPPGTKWTTALPFFNRTASYKYAFAPLSVIIPILAAMGVENILSAKVTSGRLRRAAVSIGIFMGFFVIGGWIRGVHMNLVGTIAGIIALSLIAASPLIVRYRIHCIILIVWLELFVHFHQMKPRTILDPRALPNDPQLIEIVKHSSDGRFAATSNSGFLPNLNLIHRLHDINLFDALYPKSFVYKMSMAMRFDYSDATNYFKNHAYSFPIIPEAISSDIWPKSGVKFYIGDDLSPKPSNSIAWGEGIAKWIPPIVSDNWELDIGVKDERSERFTIKFNKLPGWTAAIDGVPTQIADDNGFIAITIPKTGGFHIELRYIPFGFKLGFWITLTSILTLTLSYVVGILLYKRKQS